MPSATTAVDAAYAYFGIQPLISPCMPNFAATRFGIAAVVHAMNTAAAAHAAQKTQPLFVLFICTNGDAVMYIELYRHASRNTFLLAQFHASRSP